MYRIENPNTQEHFDWWAETDPGEAMLRTARRIATSQQMMKEQHLWHARLHGGLEIAGLSPSQTAAKPLTTIMFSESVGLNVIENMCSAAQAEICQNKPKATFVTDGGNWDLQQKAEKLTKFAEGILYSTRTYERGPEVFLDATVFGTGAVKVYEEDGTIQHERVYVWELWVDPAEAMYGAFRTLYQTKYIDRYVLRSLYPRKKKQILEACTNALGAGTEAPFGETTADLVQVVEAWRVPSKEGAGDGRHVIAIDGCTLVDEEWTRPDFPFVFLRWMKRPFGFWGKGLTEQLAGIQKEINRLLLKIQKAFARLGITRVFVERGSKVVLSHLRNNDGDIIEYTGTPPHTVAASAIAPEVFTHLWALYDKAYQITGISQMTAQGSAPPPGVDSGKAIRSLAHNYSKRMVIAAMAYEQMFMDIIAKDIALARQIAERDGGYKIKWHNETGMEEIDFKHIDMDEDQYVMRPYPTSALPSNPSERWAMVQEWLSAGAVTKDQFLQLLDFPDTKAFTDMNPAIASYKAIMAKLNDIVTHGEEWVPDPFVNLDQALALAVPFLLNAERSKVPEERLEMLRKTVQDLTQAKDEMNASSPPPQQPPPEEGQPPPPEAAAAAA